MELSNLADPAVTADPLYLLSSYASQVSAGVELDENLEVARLAACGMKINSSDPALTAICTACATPPLIPFLSSVAAEPLPRISDILHNPYRGTDTLHCCVILMAVAEAYMHCHPGGPE